MPKPQTGYRATEAARVVREWRALSGIDGTGRSRTCETVVTADPRATTILKWRARMARPLAVRLMMVLPEAATGVDSAARESANAEFRRLFAAGQYPEAAPYAEDVVFEVSRLLQEDEAEPSEVGACGAGARSSASRTHRADLCDLAFGCPAGS